MKRWLVVVFWLFVALLPRFAMSDPSGVRFQDLKPVMYDLPPGLEPGAMVVGSDRALWFVEEKASAIGRFTTDGQFTSFPVAKDSHPTALTVGGDGSIWYIGKDRFGHMKADGTFTEVALAKNSLPMAITRASDGGVWFSEGFGDRIVEIAADGTVREHPIPRKSFPIGLIFDQSGVLWVAENGGHSIIRMSADGSIINLFSRSRDYGPNQLAVGSDGNIWFTDLSDRVGFVTADGKIRETPDPFDRYLSRHLADGQLTYLALGHESSPNYLTAGPDRAMWFTLSVWDRIGRIGSAGSLLQIELDKGCTPTGITVGPDSALWFTCKKSSKIGRISLPDPSVPLLYK